MIDCNRIPVILSPASAEHIEAALTSGSPSWLDPRFLGPRLIGLLDRKPQKSTRLLCDGRRKLLLLGFAEIGIVL